MPESVELNFDLLSVSCFRKLSDYLILYNSVTPHPRNSRFNLNEVGVLVNGERGSDDNKTLANINFAVG